MELFSGKNALRNILLLAFAVRLLAVFFAKGYLMHDDHFLTVEPAGSWAAGNNFNDWLPGISNERTSPEPISFFYPGLLYVLFSLLNAIGIDSPENQMYFIRFFLAAYSLLIVFLGFRITELIGTRKQAILVGLLLSFIAILPNFSVRNLVEIFCIPPLMAGFYLLLKNRNSGLQQISTLPIILAAILMGLAVGIRYQTVLIVAGVGFVLFLNRNYWKAVAFGVVSFIAFFLTQIDDVILWGGEPFQHLFGYFEYNKTHAGQYPGSPLTYLSFVALFILPPVSLFLLFGFIRSAKKYLLIFLPVTVFLLFHILYPNRQERFILPALPFVVILGIVGWDAFREKSKFWLNNLRLHDLSWKIFWAVNLVVMFTLCFTYSKKSRVESMVYLSEQADYKNFIQDFSYSESGALLPQFYSGKWTGYYTFRKSTDFDHDIVRFPDYERNHLDDLTPRPQPNYILFVNDDELQMRIDRLMQFFPSLTYCTTFEPGWLDILLNKFNKHNKLERIHVYKIAIREQ